MGVYFTFWHNDKFNLESLLLRNASESMWGQGAENNCPEIIFNKYYWQIYDICLIDLELNVSYLFTKFFDE